MVGKQAWNNFLEFILPLVTFECIKLLSALLLYDIFLLRLVHHCSKVKNWIARRNINKDEEEQKAVPLMEEDEDLQELGAQGLFFEYLEMG